MIRCSKTFRPMTNYRSATPRREDFAAELRLPFSNGTKIWHIATAAVVLNRQCFFLAICTNGLFNSFLQAVF